MAAARNYIMSSTSGTAGRAASDLSRFSPAPFTSIGPLSLLGQAKLACASFRACRPHGRIPESLQSRDAFYLSAVR